VFEWAKANSVPPPEVGDARSAVERVAGELDDVQ
jgi:hypothetical protein